MAKVVELRTFIGKESADYLREWADAMERGEVKQYALVAETKDGRITTDFASPQIASLAGIVTRLANGIQKAWETL